MKPVPGANVGRVEFGEIEKVADLIYFDGPLLSLFRNNEGENILYNWCDSNAKLNRWLVFTATDQQLEGFLRREIPLRALLTNPPKGFLYCLDMADELNQQGAVIVSPTELPAHYIPGENSFYEDTPVLATGQKRTTLKVSIDGEWSFYDFNYFPRLLREAYAFVCTFLGNETLETPLPLYPMRDGFSTLHLFRDILWSLDASIEPSLRGVRYASPGAIVFNVDRDAAAALLTVLQFSRDNSTETAEAYYFLRGLLSEHRFLGEDASLADVPPPLDQEFGRLAISLARSMGLPNADSLWLKVKNGLVAAKIMLAFCRLVDDRLMAYERDGRMRIPTLP